MKKKTIIWGTVVIAAAIVLGAMVGTATILPLDENGNVIRADLANDDEDYLDAHWAQIEAELGEHAVDINELLKNDDLSAVTGQYCTGSGNQFTVTGTVKVLDANTESKSGYLVVAPEGYDGKYTIQIQIGTIFKGSALRDSLTCISFSDFDNQMDWSAISSEIMKRIYDEKLSALDMASLTGGNVKVTGCFTLSGDTISIQPFDLATE